MKARLEVHEHCFIRGGRSGHLRHSHEGDAAHEHPDTGPASYTIDKDEWARATGLKGGGRKVFTDKPTGEQLPVIATGPQSFDLFILDSARLSGSPGDRSVMPAAERMAQAFGMTVRVHDLRHPAPPAASGEPET